MIKTLTSVYLILLIVITATAQPMEVREIPTNSKNLTKVGNMVFFTSGDSLWKSDGTSTGTVLVKSGLKAPNYLFEFNGRLYFLNDMYSPNIYGYYSKELWRSDGTSSGTILLQRSDLNDIRIIKKTTNYLYFTSEDNTNGRELYRTDGTQGGTILLKDINPGSASSSIETLQSIGNIFLFAAFDPDHGQELWKTDGTSTGTSLVKDINPGPSSSITTFYDEKFYELNGQVIFKADDGSHGNELWKSDGTSAGTVLLKDLTPGSTGTNIGMLGLNSTNNKLIFYSDTITAKDQVQVDFHLWSSDGTTEGTTMIYTWSDEDPLSTNFYGFDITYKGKFIFYISRYGSYDTDLWSTDGNAGGTNLIKYLGPFPDGGIVYTDVVNNYLVFYGTDEGNYTNFYRSDGTEAGTVQFYTINDFSYGPWDPTKDGNKLYFSDDDGPSYYGTPDQTDDYHQLMETDVNTTESLRSIYGVSLAGTKEIENVNGKLFFITVNDLFRSTDHTARLWTYDPSQVSTCTSKGSILREYFANVPGYAISGIPVDSTPTSTSQPTSFDGPRNIGDYYGERYRGYICVPVTGNYTFWISSDDNSELWLSTDANPAHKVKIAYVTGYTNYQQWDKYASQQSAPINLIAGRKYYIEALHKEATGNDHITVGWQLPNGTLERPIPGNRLSPFTGFPNFEPKISITNPSDSSTFTAPVSITINAPASDSNGTIVAVEFYQGTTLLGKDSTAPYSFTWNNVAPGNYKLTAKAYDNGGATETSAAVTITVNGVQGCTASGSISRELWSNVTGTGVNTIPVTTTPTSTSQVSLFEGSVNVGDNYGARYRGYICPPVSGNYIFWIASDDYSELWLSTNDNPSNKVRIAYVNGYTASRQWTKYTTQQSAQINLVAGQRYYIEALHKEAYGNDNLAVGWLLPNGVQERPIGGNRLSPYTTSGNQSPVVSITSPTNEQSFTAPATITINANASDPDGNVTKVEFFHEGTKIGEDLSSPYSITWNNVTAGSYTLTAKATDNEDAQTTSEQVAITVTNSGNCTASGTILRELWTNVTGTTVSTIPINSTPNSTSQLSLFEGSINVDNNYGARYRGYLCAPSTGNYTFWIASDDYSELWLSTDDNPSNKVRIAYVNGFTASRQWTKYTTQQSAPITLEAGQRYYIEALHKEAYGNDNLAVGWQLPSGALERPIPGNRLSPYNSPTVAPKEAMTLEQQPLSDSVDVRVFPNPTQKGIITLTVEGYEGTKHSLLITILNQNGDLVYDEKVSCEITCRRTPIIIDEKFPKGLYIMKVIVNDKILTKRLVVE